jgi:hypothetical protein
MFGETSSYVTNMEAADSLEMLLNTTRLHGVIIQKDINIEAGR